MGKIRTRFLGDDELEKKQKKEAKERAERKKTESDSGTSPTPAGHPLPKGGPQKDLPSEGSTPRSRKRSGGRDVIKSKKIHVRGKKYAAAKKKVDEKKKYSLPDAVELIKKMAYASFDESVELHLNVLETGLRGEVSLPYSTGRTVRIAIVDDAVLEKIESGTIDFDVLIAHPSFMPRLAKYARVLGPKGLMPNPKAGTISPDPEKVAEKFKKGAIRWKTEPKFPLIHQVIAKLSADTKEIVGNAESFIDAVGRKNITALTITSTMTPGVAVEIIA